MKKNYNQPETQVTAMMPQSIICASGGGLTQGQGGTSVLPPGTNTGGGTGFEEGPVGN